MVKNLLAMQETQVCSLGQEDPLEKEMAIHFNILAWEIPWTRSLPGYSPWGCKELDRTKCPHFGEGNGTPLQYSCLENPMGGGAW